MPEALSSLAVQPLSLSTPQAGSPASQPGGAQSADGAFARVLLTAKLAAHTTAQGAGLNPDGETTGDDSAQPGGQVLPELALTAVSDTPAGGAANYPPNAADKDVMQADGTMDNTGARDDTGAADEALPLQLPLPASAAAQ
ncbi:MAG: hypothetical protein M1392_06455, partial [Gammaproteobacteria bacterium]|nr:hypothetical protein [Gammaproteobacteria bacterium]